jgi:hypothetical protein
VEGINHMRVTIISSRSFKAHLDVEIWYQVVIFIYQLPKECQPTFHTSQPPEPTPSSVELLPSFYIYPLPPGSELKRSSREHTAAFSTINYFRLFFLSWSLHFLVSPFRERIHQKARAELVRTNLQRCSSRLAVPAVHRVVLSAEICYESSIRIQVSGSESGVRLPGVLGGVVMNIQSPVGRREPCCAMEIGVLSTRFESKDPENAVVGGNDCGISLSILVLRSV